MQICIHIHIFYFVSNGNDTFFPLVALCCCTILTVSLRIIAYNSSFLGLGNGNPSIPKALFAHQTAAYFLCSRFSISKKSNFLILGNSFYIFSEKSFRENMPIISAVWLFVFCCNKYQRSIRTLDFFKKNYKCGPF